MSIRADLIALAKLLAPKDKLVATEAVRAIDDPAGYFRDHNKRMAERGMSKPTKALPSIALVDALIKAKRLVSTDWKTDFENITGKLTRILPKRSNRWTLAAEDRATDQLLQLIGGHLVKTDKLVLAHLDISSDSYQLVAVKPSDVRALQTLAKRVGFHKVVTFTGKPALKKKSVTKRSGDASKQTQFIHPDGRCCAMWREKERGGPFVLHEYTRPLGFDAAYKPPYLVTQNADTIEALAALREQATQRRLAEGFVAVSRAEYLARDVPT